jgi:hypothetical protein
VSSTLFLSDAHSCGGLRPLANQGAPSGAAVVVLEPAAILGSETLYNGVREAHFTA